MPASSKAQFRYFKAAERRGDVSGKTANEFTSGVSYKSLPERKTKRGKSRGSVRRTGRNTRR